MTKEELIQYYADLLIIQYKNKPKAKAHIELLADIFTIDLLPIAIKNSFDLDSAVGEQLDFIGKYFNAPRSGKIVGSVVTLNDSEYRNLIKILQVTNNSEATLYDMQRVLFDNFGSSIYLYDYKNMRMGYYLSQALFSSTVAQFIVLNDLLPYPMGVGITATIFVADISFVYGMVEYSNVSDAGRAPLNSYPTFNFDYSWLGYKDSIGQGVFNDNALTEDSIFNLITEDGSQITFE